MISIDRRIPKTCRAPFELLRFLIAPSISLLFKYAFVFSRSAKCNLKAVVALKKEDLCLKSQSGLSPDGLGTGAVGAGAVGAGAVGAGAVGAGAVGTGEFV